MSSGTLPRSSNMSSRRTRSSVDSVNSAKRRTPSSMAVKDEPQLPRMTSSPADIPVSVASLLNSTAIPMPRKRRQGGASNTLQGRKRSTRNSPPEFENSQNSHLDFLLGCSDDVENNEKTIGCYGGSVDSSLPLSVPSLDHDDDLSTTSSNSSIRSSIRPSPPLEKKHKLVFSPENCELDHPLLPEDSSADESDDNPGSLASGSAHRNKFAALPPFPKLKASFKSNITSSLRALKAAAHTVSNFASPSIWVNNNNDENSDTQPVLHISPELTDDKRPNLLNEVPSPALRRYLNPGTTYTKSIQSYHESSKGRHKPIACTTSVQLQTYNPSSSTSSSSDTDSGDAQPFQTISTSSTPDECLPSPPSPRHREPRENSDFLRMLVLELSMRRQGKIQPSQPGRARVWLPPRKQCSSSRPCSTEATAVSSPGGGKRETPSSSSNLTSVPQRWTSLARD